MFDQLRGNGESTFTRGTVKTTIGWALRPAAYTQCVCLTGASGAKPTKATGRGESTRVILDGIVSQPI